MGWTSAEEFISQMIYKVTDRRNVYGSVEVGDGCATRVVADYAETFRL